MITRKTRHRLLQTLFWNPMGAAIVHRLVSLERMFDTIVRGYNLMGISNGETWLKGLIGDTPIVFDVGFHDGASTAEFLALRPKARVYSFDPSRFSAAAFEREFGNDPRASFLNAALSSRPGELEFFDYGNMSNSLSARKEDTNRQAVVYRVPVTTIDAYCADGQVDRIDFLKIDAEGYDLHVLEGARETLARQNIDIFMFEFASGWAATKRYLWEADEFVTPLPYRLFRLFNGFLCPLEYDVRIDSCCTLSAMYVGVSDQRLARGDIPLRNYRF